MREFTVGTGEGVKYVRMLLGGKVNSGKTSFAATAPRPLILFDVKEGGWATLEPPPRGKYDPRLLWDPKCPPRVAAMENMADYFRKVGELEEQSRAGRLPFGTLVFDSLSIYTERVLGDLKELNKGQDPRQRYGELADAVRMLVTRIHALPLHVIWLCHINDEDDLIVAGKAAHATWAYMDLKLLTRADVQQTKDGSRANYQIHTRPFRRASWIGYRGPALPDPMIPSFKVLAYYLGLPEKPVSPSLPCYNGIEYWNGAVF